MLNEKDWELIRNKIKNTFNNNDEITFIKQFPNSSFFDDHLTNSNIIRIPLICINIDIEKSKNKISQFGIETWVKIQSQFINGVSAILLKYGAKNIQPYLDSIQGLFPVSLKSDIDNAMDCAFEINTFKYLLNYELSKLIPEFNYVEDDLELNFGIGLWYSSDNYVTKLISQSQEMLFMGDSINYAHFLSKKAARTNYVSILFNDAIYNNLTDEYRNNDMFECIHYNNSKSIDIYGSRRIYKDFLEWIKKNENNF